MNTFLHIAKHISNQLKAKRLGFLSFSLALLFVFSNKVSSAQNVTYNDGSIHLKVWLHSVYTDANCEENFVNGPTKFVYNKIDVRASNGTGWSKPDFPAQNLINLFPQDMRFRLKSKKLFRFYKISNITEMQMLNPFYPFAASSFQNKSGLHLPQTFIGKGASEKNFNTNTTYFNKVGIDGSDNGYLLLDRDFNADQAPDRYQWRADELFESDADMYAKEAGGLAVFNIGCTQTFGLPQYYEGSKTFFPYDLLMNLLILDSVGLIDMGAWGLVVGNCTNLFGITLDPLGFTDGDWRTYLAAGIGLLVHDYDDAYATKTNWDIDPALFRSTPPGEVGYFVTDKYYAKSPDKANEGYMMVFAHQWNWIGKDAGYPEPGFATIKNQAKLCADTYDDGGKITLNVTLDGYFTSAAHDGKDKGGFILEALKAIGQTISLDPCGEIRLLGAIPEAMFGTSERYIRAKAWIPGLTGEPNYANTIKNSTEYPVWFKTNQTLLNRPGANPLEAADIAVNPNTFQYKFQSWESDCYRNGGANEPISCEECYLNIGNPNNKCCTTRLPDWLGGGCVWPPLPESWRMTTVKDFDQYSGEITGTVNWRNSPPNTDNFVYVPVFGGTYKDHIVRLKYKWTIPNPLASNIEGADDVRLCPGQSHFMEVLPASLANATFKQWQYIEVDGTVSTCPADNDPGWKDINNEVCNSYTVQANFTGSRYYRLKVFNRNGIGSKTSSGDKFAVAYSSCVKVSVLEDLKVPMDPPAQCGTASNPTPVRSGANMRFRPTLPPKPGSTSIPGIRYTWEATNATVTPAAPSANPWETVISMPTAVGVTVRVIMTTVVTDVCPTLTNQKDTCYFITEDPGCSGTTGVIYVSNTAGPGGVGSIANPFSLKDAIGSIGPGITHVKLLAGDYTVDGSVAIPLTDSLVFEGGYIEETNVDGDLVWTKKSDAKSKITSDIIEVINDSIVHRIGFKSQGNDWILQDIEIKTNNAPDRDVFMGTAPAERGISNYAIHVDNSTGWELFNVKAEAGQAGRGSSGRTTVERCPTGVLPMGAEYGNRLEPVPPCIGVNRNGREGGFGTSIPNANGVDNFTNGVDCSLFPTSPGCGGRFTGAPGKNGLEGVNGGSGIASQSRTIPELVNMHYFIPKGRSGDGQDGGGGGSGAAANGTGGNGGRGAVGGVGGQGGYGSGSAFGIWVSGSSKGKRNLNTNISVTVLNGISGAPGGVGKAGYKGEIVTNGAGNGGNGGTGGNGGEGATGGINTNNQNEYIQAGSTFPNAPNSSASSTNNPIVYADYGSGCTNSKIIVRKEFGDWSTFLTAYPDIRYNATSTDSEDSPKFIYAKTKGVNAINIASNGTPYKNQIYIRYDRPLPTVSIVDTICSGTAFTLDGTPGMANPIDHEWVIQKTPVNDIYDNPVPSQLYRGQQTVTGVTLPANTGSTIIKYQVRYRVKDNCCGWSVPIYHIISVLPEVKNKVVFNTAGPTGPVFKYKFTTCKDDDIQEMSTELLSGTNFGSWNFQWQYRVQGETTFNDIPGATSENYTPPAIDSTIVLEFRRLLIPQTAEKACGELASNILIVEISKISNNVIQFPSPLTAECGPDGLPVFANSDATFVHTGNANIGLIEGAPADGLGDDPNNYYYKWYMKPGESGAWTAVDPNFPSDSPTQPTGYGESAQDWNPGIKFPNQVNFGNTQQVFDLPANQTTGNPGRVYFKRVVSRSPSDAICMDTSNTVYSEILSKVEGWGFCNGSGMTAAQCKTAIVQDTAINGTFRGTCAIIAPDTVCPGSSIYLNLPTTSIGTTTLRFADSFVWYSVEGGPFNAVTVGPPNPCNSVNCTNPMSNTNCSNGKPGKNMTTLITTTPYDPDGIYYVEHIDTIGAVRDTIIGHTFSRIQVQIDTTTTYYVNAAGRCFDDAAFRATANPETYTSIGNPKTGGGGQNWQRRTVITVTPYDEIKGFDISNQFICTGQEPDSITLTIAPGSNLGNDGYFAIYSENPGFTLSTSATLVHKGIKRDTTLKSRQVTIPAPTVSTTYYARIENRCTASMYDTVRIEFVTPSDVPDLSTNSLACQVDGNATVTITVNGTLRNDASWVLYDDDPLNGGSKLATTKGNTFTRSITGATTFYVRGESKYDCDTTIAVPISMDNFYGAIEYAPDNATTLAVEQCTDADGWTWYATTAQPNKYLFAIQKKPASNSQGIPSNANSNNFTAEVVLTVTANPTLPAQVFYAEDPPCEANFVMPRYWNVHVLTGSLNGYVKIRFFYRPEEYNATQQAADAWVTAYIGACPNLHRGPGQVFKTTDNTDFDPKSNGGKVGLGSDVNLLNINDGIYVAYLLSNLSPSPYPYGSSSIQNKNFVEVAWDGFSGGGISIRVSADTAVLPVTLVKFTGTLVGDHVLLDWETASEHNNDYFVVERSRDAKNWEDIGRVKGNGSTDLPHFYNLIDSMPYQGVNYYRLRQVDYDASVNYSRIIQVELTKTGSYTDGFISVQPNPTAGPILATIGSPIDQHVNILILDISGRIMGNQEVDLGQGINHIKMNLGQYPAGTYILSYKDKTNNAGKEHIAKVVKQ